MNENIKDCIHRRVIIHVDFDCFYAQVEMVKNPDLKYKPLGVRQKNIIVTCNYLAREQGVQKLMLLKTAQEICPDLVIVPGEDLTNYRDISYKVSSHLQCTFPLVQKLGLDENIIDVSDLIENYLENKTSLDVVGHNFKSDTECSDELEDPCLGDCHQRLIVGTVIAQQIRDSILNDFGLTSCAGIGHNKLLAKLVCGIHKPNQQTVLFPQQATHLLKKLSSVSKIPGIGPSMTKKLASQSIKTISELQQCSIVKLESIIGKDSASTVHSFSFGIDDSPVIPFGKPLSVGLEDSFQKGLTSQDCEGKINVMIRKLLVRIEEDGRTPHTVRLTIRKGSKRETRQCPLPQGIFKSGNSNSELETKISSVLLSLFLKLVDRSVVPQLTLIGVTFTKLSEPETFLIDRYLKRPSCSNLSFTPESKRKSLSDARIPANVDPEIFEQLPEELKNELLKNWSTGDVSAKTSVPDLKDIPCNIDSQVFMELPAYIQSELRQKWKRQYGQARNIKPNSIRNYFTKK